MLPMLAVRLQLGELLAADPTTLAPAGAANKVALIQAAFTPDENLVVGDLVLATFDGSTPKSGATGDQSVGVDPNTGEQIIVNKDPVGGWRWIVTGTTALPQTIYGYALLDATLATLLAVGVFPTPIPLTGVGQQIVLGVAELRISVSPVS